MKKEPQLLIPTHIMIMNVHQLWLMNIGKTQWITFVTDTDYCQLEYSVISYYHYHYYDEENKILFVPFDVKVNTELSTFLFIEEDFKAYLDKK